MSATDVSTGIPPIAGKARERAIPLVANAPEAPEPHVDAKWSGRKTLIFIGLFSMAAWAAIISLVIAIF